MATMTRHIFVIINRHASVSWAYVTEIGRYVGLASDVALQTQLGDRAVKRCVTGF